MTADAAEVLEGGAAGATLIAISAVLGGISTFVAMFVVASMLAFLVQQRRSEVALLRAVAATPRQVRRLIRAETMLVTTLGGLAGLLPGVLLGRMIIAVWRDRGILPKSFHSDHGGIPVLAAFALAMITGQVAASIAAARASRVHPTEALRGAERSPRAISKTRALVGVLAAAGTGSLLLVCIKAADIVGASVLAPLATSLLVVVALFAPLLSKGGAGVVGLFARPLGPAGYLAAVNTRAYAARIAVVVMPVVLLVTVAAMSLLQQATLDHELATQSADRLVADQVISAPVTGLPLSMVGAAEALPDVETAVGLLPTTVYAGSYLVSYPAQAISDGLIESVLDLDVIRGSAARLEAGEVAISENLADALDADVGQLAQFHLGDGASIERRVGAIYRRDRGFGDVLLRWDDVIDHVSEPLLSTALIRTGPTTPSPQQSAPSSYSGLEQLVGNYPGSSLGGTDNYHDAAHAEADARAWIGYMLFGMVTVFTAIAVVNTIAMNVAARSREFALLRLLGTTPRQLVRMMRWEALMSIATGSVLGATVGILTLAPFSIDVTGNWLPHLPARLCVIVLSSVAALAAMATIVPTRLALRARPIETI